VGMHGDELDGPAVVSDFLSRPTFPIRESLGETLLVLANPVALAAGGRSGRSGVDLNRLFGEGLPASALGTGEAARAAVLREHLSRVDVLLDLHQTTAPGPSMAVIRDTEAHLRWAADLGASFGVLGMEDLYGSVMLAQWIDREVGVGLTIETGQVGTPASRAFCGAILHRFLGEAPFAPAPSLPLFRVQEALNTPAPGLRFERALHNGSTVRAGELLGTSESGPLVSPRDSSVLLPTEGSPVGTPCMLLASLDSWARP